jgi:hypothetical protein
MKDTTLISPNHKKYTKKFNDLINDMILEDIAYRVDTKIYRTITNTDYNAYITLVDGLKIGVFKYPNFFIRFWTKLFFGWRWERDHEY